MKLCATLWDVIIIGYTAASKVIKHSLGSIMMKNVAGQNPIFTRLYITYTKLLSHFVLIQSLEKACTKL